jgi:hypothetical protein
MVILLLQRQHRLEAVVSDNDPSLAFFSVPFFADTRLLLDTFSPLVSLSLSDIFSPLIYSLSLLFFLSLSLFSSSGS